MKKMCSALALMLMVVLSTTLTGCGEVDGESRTGSAKTPKPTTPQKSAEGFAAAMSNHDAEAVAKYLDTSVELNQKFVDALPKVFELTKATQKLNEDIKAKYGEKGHEQFKSSTIGSMSKMGERFSYDKFEVTEDGDKANVKVTHGEIENNIVMVKKDGKWLIDMTQGDNPIDAENVKAMDETMSKFTDMFVKLQTVVAESATIEEFNIKSMQVLAEANSGF